MHSRFFRLKRKEHIDENQMNTNGESLKDPKQITRGSPTEIKKIIFTDASSTSLIKNFNQEKKTLAQSRSSVPSIYPGYQRKKSQSVKLTIIDQNNAYEKKAVRFADDFGLELSQIKMIKTDELPYVPSAAFKDLQISNDYNSLHQERMKVLTYMEAQFENPMHIHGFDDRVLRQKVILEQANAIDNRIYGTVRIISFSLHKRVKVRVTTNNWISSRDHDATYIINSFDGTHDRFSFMLEIDRDRIYMGNNIQFCLCYQSYGGLEYWDNNYHQNYRFNCFSRTISDYSN